MAPTYPRSFETALKMKSVSSAGMRGVPPSVTSSARPNPGPTTPPSARAYSDCTIW